LRLTLSTLRCPDAVAPETRSTGGGEFSLGRAPDNSWVLPDPERHLSKRHCVLAFRNGGWQIADLSTNGTFLNRETTPIGQGAIRDLRDGDRIRLGAYEIELRIEEEALSPAQPSGMQGAANPFDDDPFAPAPPPASSGFGAPEPIGAWRDETPMLPADFDPLAPAERDPFTGPSIADHSPAVSDAFRAPAVSPAPLAAGLLPDDWDLDEPLVSAAAPPPVPVPMPVPAAEPAPPAAFAPPPEPSLPPPARQPSVATPFDDEDGPVAPPVAPQVAATPIAPVQPARPAAPVAAPAPDGALLAAFLRGAGMPGARIEDPAATMEALGASFRAVVSGLRSVLIARAAIKGEFRIEQTMIRARGNNPLKFSADDDDALSALIGTGRRTNMGPAEAVAEALRDMRLHELASVAAMQKAVREMLNSLSPAAAQEAAGGGGLLPMQKKARAFEAFEEQHAALLRALSDDFDSAFGKAFARAYEEALREVAARPEDR
jgi:type VI secretion system protein ImpI/type VI secretion system protein